jgi:hypothetical protein
VSLEFHDVDGNLTFSPSGDNTIRIKIKKEIRSHNARRAERLFRDTTVDFSQNGNSLVIRIRYPHWRGFFFWIGDFQRVKVTSEIFLPENSRLKVDLVDGEVRGSGLKGEMNLKTVDGDIRLSQIQGTIQAKTTDGEIDFKDIDGRVLADTVDGRMAIAGALKELRLKSTDGDIRVDCSSFIGDGKRLGNPHGRWRRRDLSPGQFFGRSLASDRRWQNPDRYAGGHDERNLQKKDVRQAQ